MKKTKTPSHAPLPTQQQQQQQQHHTPPNTPSLSRTAFIRRLKLKHQQSYTTDHNEDEDEAGTGDHDHEDDASELSGLPSLSSSPSSTSLTIETRSPLSPVHDDVRDLPRDDDRSWISSAACDDDLKEWGQYLDEAGEHRRRLSGATAASSTGWSAIAMSCEDCVQH
jgi:hypothetical protein